MTITRFQPRLHNRKEYSVCRSQIILKAHTIKSFSYALLQYTVISWFIIYIHLLEHFHSVLSTFYYNSSLFVTDWQFIMLLIQYILQIYVVWSKVQILGHSSKLLIISYVLCCNCYCSRAIRQIHFIVKYVPLELKSIY